MENDYKMRNAANPGMNPKISFKYTTANNLRRLRILSPCGVPIFMCHFWYSQCMLEKNVFSLLKCDIQINDWILWQKYVLFRHSTKLISVMQFIITHSDAPVCQFILNTCTIFCVPFVLRLIDIIRRFSLVTIRFRSPSLILYIVLRMPFTQIHTSARVLVYTQFHTDRFECYKNVRLIRAYHMIHLLFVCLLRQLLSNCYRYMYIYAYFWWKFFNDECFIFVIHFIYNNHHNNEKCNLWYESCTNCM